MKFQVHVTEKGAFLRKVYIFYSLNYKYALKLVKKYPHREVIKATKKQLNALKKILTNSCYFSISYKSHLQTVDFGTENANSRTIKSAEKVRKKILFTNNRLNLFTFQRV
jgi:hypothetical protein